MQVGKPQTGDEGTWQREALMLLQTLRTFDPDELAKGFRRWDLRIRQLGSGPGGRALRRKWHAASPNPTEVKRRAGKKRRAGNNPCFAWL
jgi:hypothetical protein